MKTTEAKPAYQNNPFFVATDGLGLLFRKARSVAIFLSVLSFIGLAAQIPQTASDVNPTTNASNHPDLDYYKAQYMDFKRTVNSLDSQEWIAIGIGVAIIILLVIMVGTVLTGINDYTAARLAKGKATTLGEALQAVFANFFGYLWLRILIGIKVFLWSLLLIIPGIIMSVRYSLSGQAFFDKKLGAQSATKYSADITKGAWLTTFASQSLFGMITLGIIQPLLQPATAAVLYGQLDDYKKKELEKPSAHVLSWLTLIIPIITAVLALLVLMIVAYAGK
jgi:hypothetical protein